MFSNVQEFQRLSEEEFVELGLSLRCNGINQNWQRNSYKSQVADFRSVYGIHPKALAAIWKDLHTSPFIEDRIDPKVDPEHILLVYRWLKSYESERELRTNMGYPEKKIRGWCETITEKVALLRRLKVRRFWIHTTINEQLIIFSVSD